MKETFVKTIIADWLEENNEAGYAKTLRWLVKHKKRPFFNMDYWHFVNESFSPESFPVSCHINMIFFHINLMKERYITEFKSWEESIKWLENILLLITKIIS